MDAVSALRPLRVPNPNRMDRNRRFDSHFRSNSIGWCSNDWNDWALSMVAAEEVVVDLKLNA